MGYFHVFGVDNMLVKPADPRFLGYCLQKGAEVGNKSVWKASPDEKVGVVAKRGEAYCVVEYSDLSENEKNKTNAEGQLIFGAGNICNHVFSLEFLRSKVLPNLQNNYHVAEKKVPCVNMDTGESVKPTA